MPEMTISAGVWGDVGQTGAGTISDPFTLPGTAIAPLADNMSAWAARVERHSQWAESLCELWYWRDSQWWRMPSPIMMDARVHPVLLRRFRRPAQLTIAINNEDGYLTKTNLESPYNYNLEAGYDPVIDAHRKVCFRVGTRCWTNLASGLLATATAAPTVGTLGQLTDGLFADFTQTTPAACQWTATDTTPVDLVFDLGRVVWLRNVSVRFGTAIRSTSGYTLPASAQVLLSQDSTDWTSYLVRPVGGAGAVGMTGGGSPTPEPIFEPAVGGGSAPVPPGDWRDDPYGNVSDIPFCAIGSYARYVKIRVTPTPLPIADALPIPPASGGSSPGAQIWAVDEIGIWGGSESAFLGANKFTGYLGNQVYTVSEGSILLVITDVIKKLVDNNEARLTNRYALVDVADIAYSLLTSSTIWRGVEGAYDYAWQESEIGWQSGVSYTGFIMPIWQGQGNNVLGYEMELWHEVGWQLWADGNGVLQATEPPYRQYRPDYVYIAAPDGNQDARLFVRDLSDADIRNVVEITTGTLKGGAAGSTTLMEPASVARYGHLRTIVTDQLATQADLRTKLAAATLRDYAWRLDRLLCELAPDYDTAIRGVLAFRTGQQPNETLGRVMLRAANCSVVGYRCTQELWSLEALEEHITSGKWWGNAILRPYVPAAIDPPAVVSWTPGTGGTADQAVLVWNQADNFAVSPVSGNGAVSAQSGVFTVSIDGFTATNSLTITLSEAPATGGVFRDAGGSAIGSLTWSGSGTTAGPVPKTFTYEPVAGYSGGRVLTLTASGAFAATQQVDYSVGNAIYYPVPVLDQGQFALAGFNVYLSSVGEDDPNYELLTATPIVAYNGSAAMVTSYTVPGLTPGTQYWCYMTAVDTNGHESEPSTIISVVAGAGAATTADWTVTDLSVSFGSVSGPDSQGYYTYQFNFLWTSPPIPAPSPDKGLYGFKRMSINFAAGALPPDPNENPGGWQHNATDQWAGARIPPGLMWDRQTPGQLNWESRMRVNPLIPSGTTMYFRMITSSSTNSWQGSGGHSRGLYQSNIASCTIP
jgi:hypothetical protein